MVNELFLCVNFFLQSGLGGFYRRAGVSNKAQHICIVHRSVVRHRDLCDKDANKKRGRGTNPHEAARHTIYGLCGCDVGSADIC